MMIKNHFLKKIFILLVISTALSVISNCTSSSTPSESSADNSLIEINYTPNSVKYKEEKFKLLDADAIKIDSLYIQVAYELSSNRWIIIGNSIEEDPTGLKLLLVDPKNDYRLLYRSKGAYQSLILNPRFFKSKDDDDPLIILCALGQMESWGQNLFLLKGDAINEIAYMDVAYKPALDSLSEEYTLKDISPFTKIEKQKDGIYFSFDTDSMVYYGEIDGIYDPTISAKLLKYKYFKGGLEEVWQE